MSHVVVYPVYQVIYLHATIIINSTHHMKLRTKTTLFLAMFFLVTTSSVVVYVEYIVGDTFREQTEHNFRTIAEQSEGIYFAFLGGMKARVVDWTSDSTVRELSMKLIATADGTPERTYLAKEFAKYMSERKMPYDKTIFITDLLDKNGIVIASTQADRIGKNEAIEDDHNFTETINSTKSEVFFSGMEFGYEDPKPFISATIRLSTPLADGTFRPIDAVLLVYFNNTTEIAGALGVGDVGDHIRTISRVSRQAFLESYRTSDIYVVNREHIMTTPSRFMKNVQLRQKVESLPVIECFEHGNEINTEYKNYQDIDVLGASMCFKDNGIVLIVEVHEDEIFAELSRLTRNTIAGGISILVFGVLVAVFFVRRPLAHLDDVVNGAKRVTDGDLGVQVNVKTNDEIGRLASMFNTMVVSIRDARRDLEASKLEVEEKARYLEQDVAVHEKQEKELAESKKATEALLEESWRLGEKLRTEGSRLQSVLSSIGDALVLIDGEYRIAMVNPRALEVFALPENKVIGKDLRGIIKLLKKNVPVDPSEWPIEEMFLTRTVITTTIDDEFSLGTAVRKLPLPVALSVAPLGGGFPGGVIVIHDTTADHELNEAKSGFISVASHQLRTPLTSIRWYAEMLLSGDVGPLNDAQKDFMTEVHGGAERLYQTVDLLLGISRVESGKIKTEKHPIDISVFTDAIAKELASQVDEKGCVLSIIKPEGDPVILSLDPLTLRQVILNLFSNAIRYTSPRNGIIEIAWKKSDDGRDIVYSVRDNGIGIPEPVRDRVFTKFFRAENARASVPDGSGLGLALVRELVESWGGKVWFETEEGKGSTFFFTVPFVL